MTINEVIHIVIIIRICVCWPMLKMSWTKLSHEFAEQQFIFSYCRFCSGCGTDHMILLEGKFRRSCAYNKDLQNPRVRQISQLSKSRSAFNLTWGFLVHLFLLLVFVCKGIQLFTDCLACPEGLVWKDRGFISSGECPEHLASICNKPLKAASKFGEVLS